MDSSINKTLNKPLNKEGVAILASELKLQLKYIRESGNKYGNIDLADQLANRLSKSFPL